MARSLPLLEIVLQNQEDAGRRHTFRSYIIVIIGIAIILFTNFFLKIVGSDSSSTNVTTIRPNVAPRKPGTKADNFRIDTLEQSQVTGKYKLEESKQTETVPLTKNQTPGFSNFKRFPGASCWKTYRYFSSCRHFVTTFRNRNIPIFQTVFRNCLTCTYS